VALDDLTAAVAKRKRAMDGGGEEVAEGDAGAEDTAPEEMDEGEESYGSVEDDAANELADLVGVGEDKRAAFKTALKQYVQACMNAEPEAEEE